MTRSPRLEETTGEEVAELLLLLAWLDRECGQVRFVRGGGVEVTVSGLRATRATLTSALRHMREVCGG